MFRVIYIYACVLFILFGITGCNSDPKDDRIVVAEVSDKKLYMSDIAEIIPSNVTGNDSILMAQDYINKWIKQELLIKKANENLSLEQKNVNKELQEYRNSLIIYKYKNELMKQRMDTVVSFGEIEDFYNSNPGNFNLNKTIVKAIFVKIPNEVSNPDLLKELMSNTSAEGLSELKDYCLQYAKGFDIFIDNWVDFETLKNNIPQEIEDSGRFLKSNNQIELNDSNYYYLVRIHDYKLMNDKAPIEYVENNIKNLILNQRKIEFLKEIEDNIYTEGIRKRSFKIVEVE